MFYGVFAQMGDPSPPVEEIQRLHLFWTAAIFSGACMVAAALWLSRCAHLDEHYWSHKRFVAAGILFVNIVVTAALLRRATPAWNDWWFYFFFLSYPLALGGLTFSRSRRLDILCLTWALTVNFAAGSDLVHSEFGKAIGIVPTRTEPK